MATDGPLDESQQRVAKASVDRGRGHHAGRHRRRPHAGRHRRPRQGLQDRIRPATKPDGRTVPVRTRTWARAIGLGLGLLAGTWFTQRVLPQWTRASPGIGLYVIQPALWTAFAFLSWRFYQNLSDTPSFSRALTKIAFLAGIFHISVVMLSGLFFEFGDNPGAGVLANYPKNALYFTTLIIGVEAARTYVFHALRSINETVARLVTVVLFAAIAIPIGQWEAITTVESAFKIGVGRYLPAIVLSAVATAFTSGGGIGVSAAYLWPIFTLKWLMPILPAYDWTVGALMGTAIPMGALVVARTLYEGTEEFRERYPEPPPAPPDAPRSWTRWSATAIAAVLIILFSNGIFGVRPYLLAGVSMEPAFERGDVIIVREVPLETLEANDVIRFRQSRIDVAHRIIQILEDDGELVFVTQGDNMERADPVVTADRVSGKVTFVIPRIGWPSLWIREALESRT